MMDLLTPGMHNVGQSDPVLSSVSVKRKLHGGYFVPARTRPGALNVPQGAQLRAKVAERRSTALDILHEVGRTPWCIVGYQ